MQKIADAEIVGANAKSQTVKYTPTLLKSGNFQGDCQSAGSIALMTQMVFPSLLFGSDSSSVLLQGGTLVSHSPPVKYIEYILFPMLKKFGIDATLQIIKDGYYPRGGGEALVNVNNIKAALKPIDLTTRGKIKEVYIEVVTFIDEEATSQEYIKTIKKDLKKVMRTKYTDEEVDAIEFETKVNYSVDLFKATLNNKKKQDKNNKEKNYKPKENTVKSILYGVLCLVRGDNIAFDCSSYSEDNAKNDEFYVDKVTENFANYFTSETCIDDHTQDQLLIFMLLANGSSRIRCSKDITEHTNSCFYIYKQFYNDFQHKVTKIDKDHIIEIQGIGFTKEGGIQAIKKVETKPPEESKTEN